VIFVLLRLTGDTKAKIERVDWNRTVYVTAFPGENVLTQQFEIHTEGEHEH